MLNLLIGILISGATLYLALLFKSVPLALLGFAQLLLLGAVVFYLAFLYSAVRCAVEIPLAAAEIGQPVAVRIRTYFRRGIDTRMVYRLSCANALGRKKTGRWLEAGPAGGGAERTYQYEIVPDSYGSYEVCLKKVRIYDMTGLFFISRRIKSRASVLVLPAIQETAVRLGAPVRNFYADADIYDAERPGYDSSELFDVRPFRDGDKIQNIHWKLSAKTDSLLVKENSLPKACPVILLFDCQKKRAGKEALNAFFSVAASLSFSVMAAGCPHYAVWYSARLKELTRMRVEDEEGLYLFLCRYMEEAGAQAPSDLTELYKEQYRGDAYCFSVLLNETLEIRVNGERTAKLDARRWREGLQGLELEL